MIGLLTIAPSIYIGIKYFDGKVVEKPYESGLTYNEDKKFISDNGLDLKILNNKKNGDNVVLEFVFDKNDGVSVADTSFFITRPASDQDLIQINTEQGADGAYKSNFSLKTMGNHILKMVSTINGKHVQIQKSFYIN